jgi:Mn-containing catalase
VSHHIKEPTYTVRVDKRNPVFARMLQQPSARPGGQDAVMNQYLFQARGAHGNREVPRHASCTPALRRSATSKTTRHAVRPSPDGPGEFSFAVRAPRLGQDPELMPGPTSVHGGVEATRESAAGGNATA